MIVLQLAAAWGTGSVVAWVGASWWEGWSGHSFDDDLKTIGSLCWWAIPVVVPIGVVVWGVVKVCGAASHAANSLGNRQRHRRRLPAEAGHER